MTAMGCYDSLPAVTDSLVFVQRTWSLCQVDVIGVSSFHVYSWDGVRGEPTQKSVSVRVV